MLIFGTQVKNAKKNAITMPFLVCRNKRIKAIEVHYLPVGRFSERIVWISGNIFLQSPSLTSALELYSFTSATFLFIFPFFKLHPLSNFQLLVKLPRPGGRHICVLVLSSQICVLTFFFKYLSWLLPGSELSTPTYFTPKMFNVEVVSLSCHSTNILKLV